MLKPILRSFKYTKANKEESYRTVYPIGVQDDKLFAIDVSDLDDVEKHEVETQLSEVHRRYITEIEEVVGNARYRLFFFEGIS